MAAQPNVVRPEAGHSLETALRRLSTRNLQVAASSETIKALNAVHALLEETQGANLKASRRLQKILIDVIGTNKVNEVAAVQAEVIAALEECKGGCRRV